MHAHGRSTASSPMRWLTYETQSSPSVCSSCPGPDRSISDEDLRAKRLVEGRYRTQRIGGLSQGAEARRGLQHRHVHDDTRLRELLEHWEIFRSKEGHFFRYTVDA